MASSPGILYLALIVSKDNTANSTVSYALQEYLFKYGITRKVMHKCISTKWDTYDVILCSFVKVLSVQKVVPHFYSKLLYKMGNYFLDM